MELTKHEYAVARAFWKLMYTSTEGWYEDEMEDRHFDGGKWSGTAWQENWDNEEDRICKIIADRFEMDYLRVLAVSEYYRYECDARSSYAARTGRKQ
jgi:hypothetical protein